MKARPWLHGLALALAALFALLAGMPVADVPVKVYGNAAALVPIFAVLAVVCAWVSLAASRRRKRDFIAAFALNFLAVLFLCRAMEGLASCYFYYAAG